MAMSDDFRVVARKTSEPAAKTAFAAGIVGLLLLWPLGLLLGPLAIWSGVSAQRRIQASGGELAGSALAVAGVVIGAVVCALSAAVLLAEFIALLSTGGLIPAP